MHFADSIVIFLLALVLFGPKKLPEIARQVGKLMMEFRRASNEFKSQIDDELRAMEQQDRQKKFEATAAQTPALSAPVDTSSDTSSHSTVDDVDSELDSGLDMESDDLPQHPSSPDHEYEDEEEDETVEPVILPPSTGETVSADRPFMPVPPPELLEAAAVDPHPVYAEALAAERNGSSNHTGPEPESAQATVNHG